MAAGLAAAQAAVATLPFVPGARGGPPPRPSSPAGPPGRRVVVGWLGDSRAYHVSRAGARQLTQDHSWVNEVVAAGRMSLALALRSPQAHCVTRTLGGATGDGDEPSLLAFDVPEEGGHLILCTDGLWNYAPEPERLAGLVRGQPAGADALSLARGLVGYALDRRGHDNVTAAVLALGDRDGNGR
jgi:serine/threonine protein phosphatase PrpC